MPLSHHPIAPIMTILPVTRIADCALFLQKFIFERGSCFYTYLREELYFHLDAGIIVHACSLEEEQ